jgi:hypothetical protein
MDFKVQLDSIKHFQNLLRKMTVYIDRVYVIDSFFSLLSSNSFKSFFDTNPSFGTEIQNKIILFIDDENTEKWLKVKMNKYLISFERKLSKEIVDRSQMGLNHRPPD